MTAKFPKKIIITGGHLTPALAVIDELAKNNQWEIIFFGRKYASEREKTLSVELQLIREKGVRFIALTAGRFPRLMNRYTFLSALKLPIGFFQALYYLLKIKPQVILSFGGYLSVPVVFWGWILRVPSLTHEQTTVKSLASKINSLFVKKVAVSWPQSVKDYSSQKVVLTGNPLRGDIFKSRQKYWQILNFPQDLPLIFVTGGNQGAHAINLAIEEKLPQLLQKAILFHQCGHLESLGDFERLEKARERLPLALKKRYHVKKYLSGQEMGTFLQKADLIVSRSGANTLTEIAALGKPALFIPMPWNYKNEQLKNAQLLEKIGLAEILIQDGFHLSSQDLLKTVEKMIKNIKTYEKKGLEAKKLVKLDAAQRIVRQIEDLV
ncbi:glycosyltransferase [Patescibacteria group bacterium]